MAERDLEMIHHKHFKHHDTNQKHKKHITNGQERHQPGSSTNKSNFIPNGAIHNRPKFTYHKVPGYFVDYLSNEPMLDMTSIRKQLSSHDINVIDDMKNGAVD